MKTEVQYVQEMILTRINITNTKGSDIWVYCVMCDHWLWCKNRRQEFIRFQIHLNYLAHPYAKANVPESKCSSSGVYVFQGVRFLFCCKCDLLQYSPTSYSQCFNVLRCIFHFLFSLIYCWRKNQLATHDSFCMLNNFILFEQRTKNRTLDSYSMIQWFLFSL